MGRVNDDQWLDEALNQALHSDDTQPDFQRWIANHPEAVKMLTARTPQAASRPPRTRRILMNAVVIKIAAAAIIAVAAIVGITQWNHNSTNQTVTSRPNPAVTIAPESTVAGPTNPPIAHATLRGPTTYQFADGSGVKLAQGASICPYTDASKRGFQHLCGQVEVTVAKGQGEFLVTTPYGEVRALGTQFTMSIMDNAVPNTRERVQLLAVTVKEGSVEVRNAQGATTIGKNQGAVVALDAAPYDFSQDAKLPARLKARVAAMLAALEAVDAAAWIANYNTDYMYKLVKGQEKYDPQRFGGSEADLEQMRQEFGDIGSPQELVQRFLRDGELNNSGRLYVRAVTLDEDGKHARAKCIGRESENSVVITTPQWHFFDNDWWQVDD